MSEDEASVSPSRGCRGWSGGFLCGRCFAELNRVVVVRLLGVLVERITVGEQPGTSRGVKGDERASRAGAGAGRR